MPRPLTKSRGKVSARVTVAGVLALLCLLGCSRPQPAQQKPKPATPPPSRISLIFVGDILLARGLGSRIARQGVEYPFAHVADRLSAADITFGNLECPLSASGRKADKPYSFKADPRAAQSLVLGGFDVVSIANNHIFDCGATGLLETLDRLRLKGIAPCGAGRTRAEAEACRIIERQGMKFAFVAFSQFPAGSGDPKRPTLALASDARVQEVIAAARRRADFVIASFHWGDEYAPQPNQRQRQLARLAAQSGADFVIGHHPHVLQGLQMLTNESSGRATLVAYSLGNFVFDSRLPKTLESVILRCDLLDGRPHYAWLLPVVLKDWRPEPADEEKGAAILGALQKQCEALGTEVEMDWVADSEAQRHPTGRVWFPGVKRVGAGPPRGSRPGSARPPLPSSP